MLIKELMEASPKKMAPSKGGKKEISVEQLWNDAYASLAADHRGSSEKYNVDTLTDHLFSRIEGTPEYKTLYGSDRNRAIKDARAFAKKPPFVLEAQWTSKVEEKWKAPEGFFEQSSKEIASGLKAASKDLAQAMERLDFEINRAGSNLKGENKKRLEDAKNELHKIYHK